MVRSKLAAIALASCVASLGQLSAARADDDADTPATASGSEAGTGRENILEDQPAVRHRLLLVAGRFELTPTFETSINADYKHTISGGLKAEYHLSDMWSIGAMGYYGTSINTGLTDRVLETLEDTSAEGEPTPTAAEFEQHLNSIPMHGAAYVSWQPWYGKMAAFGSAFLAFDFYFQGGLSFAQLENDCCGFPEDPNPTGNPMADPPIFPDRDPNDDNPLNDGTRLGVYVGGGLHVFLSEAIALDLSFRDYWFSDNPSGLDFDADLAVTEDDERFLNHFFAGVGVSVFFPLRADRTR